MRMKEGLEMIDVEVGGPLSLWQGEVEEEECLERPVERYPYESGSVHG